MGNRRIVLTCLGLLLVGCAAPPRSTLRGGPDPTVSPPPSASTANEGEVPTSTPVESPGLSIVGAARAMLGIDYRYGGHDTRGFDCSGLVHHVFARHGVEMPRHSGEQYHEGRPVAPDDLRPGDLVFFANSSGGINHVGIWTGNDRFVHASRSRGVVEDSSDSTWFRRRFVGARRIPTVGAK